MDDIFTQGNKPGSINSAQELRIVICYLLQKIGCPVTFNQLNHALQSDGLVNYFEFAQNISRLLASGHIEYQEQEGYDEQVMVLTDLGIKTADTFGSRIPPSIKERGIRAIQNCLLQNRIQIENKVLIEKTLDGYQITLTIPDVGTDLMSLKLFVPSLDICNIIKEQFLADPTICYRAVIELLTGERIDEDGIDNVLG